jgi:para-aminobenzoate synthetase component 1
MNAGECVLAGSSPECFLSVSGRQVQTRPIKGTRPRGADPEEDEIQKRRLLESQKDKAELVMIADLERNDLGKICTPGSVEVEELYRMETYSNVHHLVSIVKGELRPGVGLREIMDAMFPSGSITGAPKKRAMEILDQVEGSVRGPYTGAMGYLGLDGAMSLNVAIRTLVLSQGICHLGVGSGIVADSDPDSEYEECLAKARDMLRALRESTEAAPVTS